MWPTQLQHLTTAASLSPMLLRLITCASQNAGLQEVIPSRMSRGPHTRASGANSRVGAVESHLVSPAVGHVDKGCSRATLLAMQVTGNSDV